MPRERTSMRKIKELLRLRFECGFSTRQVSTSLHISVGSVNEYLARVRAADLTWPLPDGFTEEQLEARLFPPPVTPTADNRNRPDWNHIATELKRKGVTLRLLWEEYYRSGPDRLGYSQFCKNFSDHRDTLDPRMRQNHKSGEKLFVDYSGMTLSLTDRTNGNIQKVEVFVATLGASSYTYVEATLTQTIEDWIPSNARALAFFGGVPELIICDNLRTAVTTPSRYEATIQRTYEEMAAHYQTAILPARPRKPRDKAKVEAGVQTVEERILAQLRNRQFLSLAEINQAIRTLLTELNNRQMQGRDHSRAELFAITDQPALKPLPIRPYEIGTWSKARVGTDYHIKLDKRHYSVPHQYLLKEVEVRCSGAVVEIYHKGERIASHPVITELYGSSTQNEHMPENHKRLVEWTPERILAWLDRTGPNTRQVGRSILDSRSHPAQGYNACLGIIRLSSTHGSDATEAACLKAIALNTPSYQMVKSILANNANSQQVKPADTLIAPVDHQNIRGADYYATSGEEPNVTTPNA